MMNDIISAHQKSIDHGFPYNEKCNSGSKVCFMLPSERLISNVGFPSEKVGMSEIPLLVVIILPEKSLTKFTL